jgi:hypothetical protein
VFVGSVRDNEEFGMLMSNSVVIDLVAFNHLFYKHSSEVLIKIFKKIEPLNFKMSAFHIAK